MSSDGFDALTERLTEELRSTVLGLGPHPILSESWVGLSDKLYRIANITEIERAIGEGSTSRSSVAVSVWDGQEVALRAILERGKAPLLVRLLEEYLAFTTASYESGRAYLLHECISCARFEYGIGSILSNCWMHKEALHSNDLPLLTRLMLCIFKHSKTQATMLSRCTAPLPSPAAGSASSEAAASSTESTGASNSSSSSSSSSNNISSNSSVTSSAAAGVAPSNLPKRALESIILRWFAGIGKNAVGAFERKLIVEFQKMGVFTALLQHLGDHHARLNESDMAAALEGLCLLALTEEFETNKPRLFTMPDAGVAALVVKEQILDPTINKKGGDAIATRRKYRAILDVCSELVRKTATTTFKK